MFFLSGVVGPFGRKTKTKRENPGSASDTVDKIIMRRWAAGFFRRAMPQASKMRKPARSTMLTERNGGSPFGKPRFSARESMTAQGPGAAGARAQPAAARPGGRGGPT